MTWTILLFTALMAAWAIGGAATADNAAQCANDTVLGADTCTQARNAGTGIAVVLIFMLWFVGFMSLYAIWITHLAGWAAETPVESEDSTK